MTDRTHFSESHLARRWNKSPRTLQRWRRLGSGPAYLIIGCRIIYPVEDVLAYEKSRRVDPAASESERDKSQ